MEKRKINTRGTVTTTILLVLVALASITVASRAWMSISDYTRLRTAKLDITLGQNLRFDLVPHPNFEDYVRKLDFGKISAKVQSEKGYDMRTTRLEPVTTNDCKTFTFEDGSIADPKSGAYWEFTLHFRVAKQMLVHLTSENSREVKDGTLVTGSKNSLPEAMRISFDMGDKVMVYSPNSKKIQKNHDFSTFSLPIAENMVYNGENTLFSLSPGEDKTVVVHVWMEGTDPACEDSLKDADFGIRLRFEGTDLDNERLS